MIAACLNNILQNNNNKKKKKYRGRSKKNWQILILTDSPAVVYEEKGIQVVLSVTESDLKW